jgi:CBS-domain-containing membrane protein
MSKPIYYMTAKVSIIKNKKPSTRVVWIVSTYEKPIDIMRKDLMTMLRLQGELYTAKAKNKSIVIDEIMTKRQVGTTSHPKK